MLVPPWLGRLDERLMRHRVDVLAKVFDAMGPFDRRSGYFNRPSNFRHLFCAFVKHEVEAGGELITSRDMVDLRKLRQLQAYIYAEGIGARTDEQMPSAAIGPLIANAMAGLVEL